MRPGGRLEAWRPGGPEALAPRRLGEHDVDDGGDDDEDNDEAEAAAADDDDKDVAADVGASLK